MKFRNLDTLNDWTWGKGLQDYSTDAAAVRLDLATRLRSWVGDCFFDMGAGIDWKNLLDFGQVGPLKNAIKSLVIKTAGVLNIRNLEVVMSGRDADVTFDVDSIYGTNVSSVISITAGG